MVQLIKTVDVSSHNRPRTRAALDAWIAQGCQALIVKSYHSGEGPQYAQSTRDWVAITKQAPECSVFPYVWLFRSYNVAQSVRDAIVLFRESGENPRVIMLDCEEYRESGVLIDPGPTAEQILTACNVAREMGAEPILYSGLPWLDGMDGNRELLRGIPAWLAWYPVTTPANPTLEGFPGAVPDWLDLIGWQYTSTPVDWSVFDADKLNALASGTPAPGPSPEPSDGDWPSEWPQDAKETASRLRAELIEARSHLGTASVDYANAIADQMDVLTLAQAKILATVEELRNLRPPV